MAGGFGWSAGRDMETESAVDFSAYGLAAYDAGMAPLMVTRDKALNGQVLAFLAVAALALLALRK